MSTGQFSKEVVRLMTRAATEQGGVISGDNPTNYNKSDPLRLWVIQVGIIILFTQLLALILGRIRQPRVIAEVIGGVLLGPSVMGRIPNFTRRIFPPDSIPLLTLTATIGLVFFLFLVGLEIDTRVLRRNAKAATLISVAGLVLPLGVGAALAVPLYHQFVPDSVKFGYFVLFVAVAVGITAFPVLCRILTELRLLDTTVGIVALSAGIGNDVVGWILLALTVALVNASNGLTALYVLLAAIAYVIFLLYPVRWAFVWLARRTGSLDGGQPSTMMMTVTLLLVLVSAFFTDIIGIHAIFGGFLAGLIIPHEGGFAIAVVEKLEDLITLIFLPIYFTLSGLNTNLGLLDNGKTWGYTILICVVAFFGKFIGCGLTARLVGFNIRESGAIGSLMSCKGLVELIVLNVGLSAGILETRLFSMFVLHALVLTFITTPLTLMWYPPKHRMRVGGTAAAVEKSQHTTLPKDLSSASDPDDLLSWRTNLAVVLNKVENLPAMMNLTQLLQTPPMFSKSAPSNEGASDLSHVQKDKLSSLDPVPSQLTLHVLRLLELTDRTSAVLLSQEATVPAPSSSLVQRDAVLTVFRTFARLHRVVVRAALAVVPSEEFSSQVSQFAAAHGAEMVIVPWVGQGGNAISMRPLGDIAPASSSPASSSLSASPAATALHNPFENLFSSRDDRLTSVVQSHFVRKVFADSPVDVALFVDRSDLGGGLGSVAEFGGFGVGVNSLCHVFVPFFGGPDDRLALAFTVQLCANPAINATVVRLRRVEENDSPRDSIDEAKILADQQASQVTASAHLGPDTVYGRQNSQTRLVSDTADNILWGRCVSTNESHPPALRQALQHIAFLERSSANPLRTALELAQTAFRGAADDQPPLSPTQNSDTPTALVVVGRSRRMASDSHRRELAEVVAERGSGSVGGEVSKSMGDVAAAFVASSSSASLLVVQAAVSVDVAV